MNHGNDPSQRELILSTKQSDKPGWLTPPGNLHVAPPKQTPKESSPFVDNLVGAFMLGLIAAGVWYYHSLKEEDISNKFRARQYEVHVVARISEEDLDSWMPFDQLNKPRIVMLMENGDIVKEPQFVDGSAAIIQVGDPIDIIYDKDHKVQHARREPVKNPQNKP
jgi:hypothetical protein